MSKRLIIIPVVIMAALITMGAEGCGDKYTEPYQDAPVTGERNDDAATIIEMPDGFSNLATKCDNGNRIYVAYKGDANRASIFAVPDSGCEEPGTR